MDKPRRMYRPSYCPHLLCLIAILNSVLGVVELNAADPSNMSRSQLHSKSSELLGENNYAAAVPYMIALKKDLEEDTESNFDNIIGILTFFIGRGHMQQYSDSKEPGLLDNAIKYFTEYVESYPRGDNLPFALLNLSDSFRAKGEFAKAIPYLKRLINTGRAPNKIINKAQRDLIQAYKVEEKWEEGMDDFKQIMNQANDPETASYAATTLMEALIKLGRIDEAMELIPNISGNNPARYDVGFNVSLMEAADKLVEQEKYNEASLLYTLTLTLEQIKAFHRSKIKNLQRRLDNMSRLSLNTGEEQQTLPIHRELKSEIKNSKSKLQALEGVDGYEAELNVRKSRVYVLTGREWEGFWAYMRLINEFPEHELNELFTYSAFAQATQIKMSRYVQQLGERYLSNPDYKKHEKEVRFQLATYYHERENISRFLELANDFIERYPRHRYASPLVNMKGTTLMKQNRAKDLDEEMEPFLNKYPDSPMAKPLAFWAGVGRVFSGDQEEAYQRFDLIVRKYPNSAYYPDALYRSGLAAFALERYDEATRRLEKVVQNYPDRAMRGQSEYFLGQIAGMKGTLDGMRNAINHYQKVENYVKRHSFIKKAYFAMAELYEKNNKYNEMADTLRVYIKNYEKEGAITQAVFKLGKAYEKLGSPVLMLEEFIRAIKRYGNDVQRTGIDDITMAYAEKYYAVFNRINANIGFLQKLIDDRDFRDKMVGLVTEPEIDPDSGQPIQDPNSFEPFRKKRFVFQFFGGKADVNVDFDPTLISDFLQRKLKREDDFAKSLLQDTEPLEDRLSKWKDKKRAFPDRKPEDVFEELYAKAKANEQRTLMLRLIRALEKLDENALLQRYAFSRRDFEHASPGLLVWIGDNLFQRQDYALAKEAYNRVLQNYPDSGALMDALLSLGKFYEQHENDYPTAYDHYKRAEEGFPANPKSAHAAMKQADMLRKMDQPRQAIAIYERIMKTPSWQGEAHAEASYKKGMALFESGNYDEAHQIFQRTYVAHAFHKTWAGKSYIKDAETLKQLGKSSEATQVLDELLGRSAWQKQIPDLFNKASSMKRKM